MWRCSCYPCHRSFLPILVSSFQNSTTDRKLVSAHTITTGAAANIQAGDVNGACCRDYVFARNSQFSGGRAARDYRTATKADIQAASQDLSRIATATFGDQAQGQLRSDEAGLP